MGVGQRRVIQESGIRLNRRQLRVRFLLNDPFRAGHVVFVVAMRVVLVVILFVTGVYSQCSCTTNDDCPGICDPGQTHCGYTGGPEEDLCCEGLATFFPACIPADTLDTCYGILPLDFCESLTCAFNCTSGAGNCSVDGTACTCEEVAAEPTPEQPAMSTAAVLGLCLGSLGGAGLCLLIALLVIRAKERERHNKQ